MSLRAKRLELLHCGCTHLPTSQVALYINVIPDSYNIIGSNQRLASHVPFCLWVMSLSDVIEVFW